MLMHHSVKKLSMPQMGQGEARRMRVHSFWLAVCSDETAFNMLGVQSAHVKLQMKCRLYLVKSLPGPEKMGELSIL